MADLTLVTCRDLPEPDPDEQPLLDALAAAGIDARLAAWDDSGVDWDATPLTVIRSTWNYAHDRDGFLAWAARASSCDTVLRNSLGVVAPNTHKSYLAALERVDVPVVPTRWFTRGGRAGDAATLRSLPWARVVAKPAVGAGSLGVRAFDLEDTDELEAAVRHVASLQAVGDVLVQPELRSIVEGGERDVVWIDGDFTHTVAKRQRLADDDEQVTEAEVVTEAERLVATAALRTVPAFAQRELLYARVDVAPDELGTLRVVEMELVEPSLFLVQHEPAMRRLVAALGRDVGR